MSERKSTKLMKATRILVTVPATIAGSVALATPAGAAVVRTAGGETWRANVAPMGDPNYPITRARISADTNFVSDIYIRHSQAASLG